MSRTPLYWIEKKNEETGKWEDVNIYLKDGDEYKPWMWDTGNADYNLFELLFEKFDGAHRRVPEDLAPSARKFFDEDEDDFYGDVRNSTTNTWYDLVELRLLHKTKDAIVANEYYGEFDDEPEYINGLDNFIDIVNMICNANGIWYPKPGEVRVICAIV